MPTEVDDIDIEDVEDALLRAEELAVITGRKKTDIVADLLDDGKLNLSAGSDAEVKKDILDIAQEKAEKFKTLITTLIPVLALLLGIGAEGLGVLDVTGWGSDSMWEDDDPNNPNNYWHDDECYPAWGYDEYGYVEENNLEVRYAFQDYNTCGIEHFGGHFIITLFESGNQADQEFIRNIDFVDYINIEYTFSDLEAGTYSYRVEFHVVECEDGSCEHGDEYYMPANNQYIIENIEPVGCDAFLINAQSYILEADAENDAVRISADVDVTDEEDNCDSEQFQLTWRLYQDNQIKYEHLTYEDGAVTDPDGADYTFHTWDNVDVGTYDSKVLLMLNGELLDEQWIGNSLTVESPQILGCTDSEATNYNADATDDDGSCEYPPTEPCDVEIHNHYRGHVAEDDEQDAILVAFKVVPENCEDENIFVEIDLFQNGYAANYTWETMVSGNNEVDISHIFDGVAVGNSWIPMITASHEGNQLEQVNFWGIDIVAQEPETCEINLFDISLQTNSTHAIVAYDLDCGTDTNDLDGYNVSVQFLIYPVGNTSQENIIVYDTLLHYIQGYVDDTHTITLTNFSDNNTTHYDIYWYAIWTDADGTQQFIEQKWLNREMEV